MHEISGPGCGQARGLVRTNLFQNRPDVGRQGHRKSGHLWLVLDWPDRQATYRFFRKSGRNPDSWRNWDRQIPDKQKSDKKYGHNPDSRQAPGRIFRLIRRQTRQGQDTDSAVRQRLEPTVSNQWISFYKLFQIRSPQIQFSSWWSFKIFVFGNNISLWRNINLNLKI